MPRERNNRNGFFNETTVNFIDKNAPFLIFLLCVAAIGYAWKGDKWQALKGLGLALQGGLILYGLYKFQQLPQLIDQNRNTLIQRLQQEENLSPQQAERRFEELSRQAIQQPRPGNN